MKRPGNLDSLRLARSRLRAALKHLTESRELDGWSKAERQRLLNEISVGWRMDERLSARLDELFKRKATP